MGRNNSHDNQSSSCQRIVNRILVLLSSSFQTLSRHLLGKHMNHDTYSISYSLLASHTITTKDLAYSLTVQNTNTRQNTKQFKTTGQSYNIYVQYNTQPI